MNDDPILAVLQLIVMRAPSLLVGGVGLYVAISRLQRYPKTLKLALMGFSCLLLTVAGLVIVQTWLLYSPAIRAEPGRASEVLSYWNVAAYPVNLIALAAMAAAIFTDRKPIDDSA